MTVIDEREHALAAIVAGILGRDGVDAHEGFFDAGGDSVLALQVVSRAREAGLALTIRDVFELQTVAALALRATPVAAHVPADALPELDQADLDQFEDFADEIEDSAIWEK